MSARAAGRGAGAAVDDSAPPATSEPIEWTPNEDNDIEKQSSRTRGATPPSERSGSATTGSESVGSSPTLGPSGRPSPRWKTPRTAREFAAQANQVATMILNGEIDLDTARVYVSAGRTSAQMLTAEVQRSRFLQSEPNLSLELEGDE